MQAFNRCINHHCGFGVVTVAENIRGRLDLRCHLEGEYAFDGWRRDAEINFRLIKICRKGFFFVILLTSDICFGTYRFFFLNKRD